ncbi:MAG: MBL fold metallo-hydrolase [Candidatus Lokiarchaeota archaeon]|nr:MBL fold metallo-hydrolase [Candidatus Lokiarchaeota archaeon]
MLLDENKMLLDENEILEKWDSEGNHLFVVYENSEAPKELQKLNLLSGWGFSAAIKYNNKKILFDCGWSNSIECNNLHALNIPNKFDYIIITHMHWDHMGALSAIVDENPDAVIYLPVDFSDHLTKELEKQVKKVYRLSGKEGPVEILDKFYVTGDIKGFGSVGEQAVIFKANNFNLLIVGCMHPSLKPLYRLASKALIPTAIIGGVHGFKDVDYLYKTKIKNLFLGHCTAHLELFQDLDGIQSQNIFPGFFLEL